MFTQTMHYNDDTHILPSSVIAHMDVVPIIIVSVEFRMPSRSYTHTNDSA